MVRSGSSGLTDSSSEIRGQSRQLLCFWGLTSVSQSGGLDHYETFEKLLFSPLAGEMPKAEGGAPYHITYLVAVGGPPHCHSVTSPRKGGEGICEFCKGLLEAAFNPGKAVNEDGGPYGAVKVRNGPMRGTFQLVFEQESFDVVERALDSSEELPAFQNLLNKKYLYHPTERRRPMIAPTDTHHCYPNTAEYSRTEPNKPERSEHTKPSKTQEIVHFSPQETILT